jgi:hypothetical protein
MHKMFIDIETRGYNGPLILDYRVISVDILKSENVIKRLRKLKNGPIAQRERQ